MNAPLPNLHPDFTRGPPVYEEKSLETIAAWLQAATSAVAFTGAGVSTESGIPDFRSPGGVWAKSQPVYFDEYLRSPPAREEYWRQKAESHRDYSNAAPNLTHLAIAEWEAAGTLRGVVTQNIDGLHQDAGSCAVLELHGTARFVDCLDCGERYETGLMVHRFLGDGAVPVCDRCGGLTKHATISFGQSLPTNVLREAMTWARQADVFLALGSSLVVEPAASLPRLAKETGGRLVIINRDGTPLDSIADAVVRAPLGETMQTLRTMVG